MVLGVAALLVWGASCETLQPKTGPGTEWPCGTHGKLCSSGSCCPDDTDCGGDVPSCRPGSCCHRNDTQPIPTSDLGPPIMRR